MIEKIARDCFHIHTIGGEIDQLEDGDNLRERLKNSGYWMEDQIESVLNFSVGDFTPRPFGSYQG